MNEKKTKAQLAEELLAAQKRIAELQQSEASYQALVQALDVSLCRWQADTTLTYANRKYKEIFGVQGDPIGKKWLDFLPAESRKETAAYYQKLVEAPQNVMYEHPVEIKDGEIRQYQWVDIPTFDEDGALVEFQSVGIDITNLKQAKETLKAEQTRFSKVVDSIPGAIMAFHWQTNGELSIPYVSGAFEDVYGLTFDDIKNDINRFTERVRQDYLPILLDAVQISAETLKPWRNEYPYLHPSKGEIWIEANSIPVKNEDGSITWYGIATDITERKKSELAIRNLENKYQTMVEQSPVVVYVDEVGGSWQYLSPQLEQVTGYTVEEFTEKPYLWKSRVHPDDLKMVEQIVQKGIETGQRIKMEYRMFTRDDQMIWIHDESDVLPDLDSEKVFLQGVFYDITEQKLAQENLRLAEQRYRTLFEEAPIMNVLTENHDGVAVISGCNQLFLSTLGYKENEVIGKELADFYTLNSKELLKNGYPQALSGSTVSEERELIASDGRIIHTLLMASAIMGLDGKVIGTQASFVDITERKLADQALHASNERFTQMADNTLEVFWMFDNQQGKLIYLSRAYETTWGVSIEKTLKDNRLYIEAIHPEDRHILFAALETQAKGEKTDFEYRIVRPDGSVRWIHDRSSPIFDQNGVLVRTTGIATDNTERKKAEIALKASEAKLRSLVASQTHFVLRTNIQGKFTYWNDKYVKEFAWLHKNKDLQESSPIEAICEHHHPRTFETVEKCLANPGKVFTVELDKPARDGTIRTTLWEFIALTDENDQPTEIQCMGIEITELKRAQSALVELNRSLEERVQQRTAEVQDLYDNAPIGYHSLDINGNIIRVNQTHLSWLGYTREEFIGFHISKFMTPSSNVIFTKIFPEFLQTGWVRDVEVEMIRKDGSLIPVLISATAIYDEQKKLLMTRTAVFDNTWRHAAEQSLRRSRDELHAANQSLEKAARLKDEFLASMSHELRTPLTGILGLSETLQLNVYGELNEKQSKTIKSIEDSGRHLLELINDILDLSKIEAAQLQIQPEPASLSDICQASLQLTKGMANKKRQRVQYAKPSESVVMNVDSRRIKQVLVNLLSNAIKFTPEEGELGLEVNLLKAEQRVELIVWDKGIGIKLEDQERLFKPFVQIDSSLARQYAGTGLGLSLVQRLVEMHNGTVEFESTFGQGSRFIVTLPLDSSKELTCPTRETSSIQDENPASSLTSAGPNLPVVLLADDNETTLGMLADFLEAKQFHVVTVKSGFELLEKVGEVRPNILLVDIQMPGMDGLETIGRIRKHSDPSIATVPIIALTALSMTGDRERCIAAGANEYISKPVKLLELVNTITNFLETS